MGHSQHLFGQLAHVDPLAWQPPCLARAKDAVAAGLVDNDWVEVFNINGTLTARVVVSQRVPKGMILMYHAQEKIINVPGAEVSR